MHHTDCLTLKMKMAFARATAAALMLTTLHGVLGDVPADEVCA